MRTGDIARAVGVHRNTVLLYERWGLLGVVPREANGYRRFDETHLRQMELAWVALKFPYPGGKAPILEAVRRGAGGDLAGALDLARIYRDQVLTEREQARSAAAILERWADGRHAPRRGRRDQIGEASRQLGVSADCLRGWERDGLVRVPRDPSSGYRLYGPAELEQLVVVRTLVRAGFSLMSVLRMLRHLDHGGTDPAGALDTPSPGENPIHVTDHWLTVLDDQLRRAEWAVQHLDRRLTSTRTPRD